MDKKPSFTVPVAIVVAGVLIAGAIFFSSKTSKPVASDNTNPSQSVQVKELDIRQVNESDYIRGNPNAKVVLVEFSDTECPYCQRFHSTMNQLIEIYGKDSTLAWVYRNFPIKELHPGAPKEAEALLCAGKIGGNTGFWNYTDRIYSAPNGTEESQLSSIATEVGLNATTFKQCLDSKEMEARVLADYEDGIDGGASGTPHSVLIVQNEFDRDEVETFLLNNMVKYGFPSELVAISTDNKKVAVSGAMPQEFMVELITLLSK